MRGLTTGRLVDRPWVSGSRWRITGSGLRLYYTNCEAEVQAVSGMFPACAST